MNKQELENKINELEKQLTKLKEELNKPENKVWKPERSDIYYYIDNCGTIVRDIYTGRSVDMGRFAIGNCFKTEEEAEFAVEKLKVTAELKMFAEEYNESTYWNDINQLKWYINYTYCVNYERVYIESGYTLRHSDIYFSSEELAKQAVEKVGEERIKKYYLGVL